MITCQQSRRECQTSQHERQRAMESKHDEIAQCNTQKTNQLASVPNSAEWGKREMNRTKRKTQHK
jgi:hypothetical protein